MGERTSSSSSNLEILSHPNLPIISHAELDAFVLAIPQMFESEAQRSIMSRFLWSDTDTDTLILNLRMYDIMRRVYAVQHQEEPSPDVVMAGLRYVKNNPGLNMILMSYARRGVFPGPNTIFDIKYEQIENCSKHDKKY